VLQLWDRARPVVRTTLAVGLGGAVTVAINVVSLLIAVPIGLMADELFWAIAITEGALLLACLIAGTTLAVRRRRGLGAGVVLGWWPGMSDCSPSWSRSSCWPWSRWWRSSC